MDNKSIYLFLKRNRMKGNKNMSNTDAIKQLYALYGFELLEESHDYLSFLHSEGYFSNVEILRLDLSKDVSNLSKGYAKIGYAVKVTDFESYDSTHANLFNGFFYQKKITHRLSAEYQAYSTQQAQRLGCPYYRFVPCKYVGNENIIQTDVVSSVYSQLFQDGAQLIIVEAAAGYGKTSVSYELIKKLSDDSHGTVPIITELSKNRRAQIFKYVLLTEINAKFRGLSAELVEDEIKRGNVPLIIDGFDELLSKSIPNESTNSQDEFDVAQTMLATIAQLLGSNSNAKIVLTSRKSSIFTGDLFAEWADKWLADCEITRVQIIPPTISDWLTSEQLSVLKKNDIELDNISNPTLLTFLSSKSPESLEQEYTTVDEILNKYFDILLQREKERQVLPLSTQEQLSIMEKVAWNMVDLNESAFTLEDLKDILYLSLDENKICEYIQRYEQLFGPDHIPTEDEFFGKLAHHALLDRIPNTDNLIGFINDFIFGYLIAEYVLRNYEKEHINLSNIREKYWDLMITAYSVCSKEKRMALYGLFINSGLKFGTIMHLNADVLLSQNVCLSYADEYFDSFRFINSEINGAGKFSNCTFSYCIFNSCKIASNAFVNCKFYGCQFYNTEILPYSAQNCHLIFSNCQGAENLIAAANRDPYIVTENEEDKFERKVLEQYWRPGSDHADRRRLFNTLFRGYNQQDYSGISEAIDRLCSRNILVRKNYCIELNFSEMPQIMRILGREKHE